jgi:hypothetical protein
MLTYANVCPHVALQPPPLLPAASAYVSIRQHTSAYVSIRQHTSAYVSIRQHTSAVPEHNGPPEQRALSLNIRQHTSAYVSIRQHTSAYVSIRQHTYVSIPEHNGPPEQRALRLSIAPKKKAHHKKKACHCTTLLQKARYNNTLKKKLSRTGCAQCPHSTHISISSPTKKKKINHKHQRSPESRSKRLSGALI